MIVLVGEPAGFVGAYAFHIAGHERLSAVCPWVAVACLVFLIVTDPNRNHEGVESREGTVSRTGARPLAKQISIVLNLAHSLEVRKGGAHLISSTASFGGGGGGGGGGGR